MKRIDRRQFLQVMGTTTLTGALGSNISKALAIPANHRTGTIQDVEHIVILMQENRPFDHHFGTLRGVRGFADPRAVTIDIPTQSGTGTVPASVFLQPAGASDLAAGFAVAPSSGSLGGPVDGAFVIPPFRIDPSRVNPGLTGLGSVYMDGTDHGWTNTHLAWNFGLYNQWAAKNRKMVMSYMTRADLPYHHALADAFTVGDAYHCSIMGPTNPNRTYMWSGGVGNLDGLGVGGTDGMGAGPMTGNGLSPNNAYWTFPTFPETLQAAGVTWKIYQDLAGATFEPDFGDGTGLSFAGNYTDNSVLYFSQYANAAPGTPLFDNGCTGTTISDLLPAATAPDSAWAAWAEHLFDQFRSDVQSGNLPQVSWIVAPAGYTEHASYPMNYGAWYISQVLDILVSNPDVFSKTVFIINYDEADGSFDHVVPPTPPATSANGASTVDYHNELVTTATPNAPIGLGTRVPFLAISPWSKGGYVNSQVFDHTSTIRFIEQRFGVVEKNISPWRRTVAGDLTSVFDFADPNRRGVALPSTDGFLPPSAELSGASNPSSFNPAAADVVFGVPAQEKGIRPARALPYELRVRGIARPSAGTFDLTFSNTGKAGAVFQVRSAIATDPVRNYTVEAGKQLTGSWSVASSYDLSVYGPNGFARFFKGRLGTGAAALDIHAEYGKEGAGSIEVEITNVTQGSLAVTLLDAYTGHTVSRTIGAGETHAHAFDLDEFHGWYDLVVTVHEDAGFRYRLAGHVETGRDSFSDPAMGGLVTLKV